MAVPGTARQVRIVMVLFGVLALAVVFIVWKAKHPASPSTSAKKVDPHLAYHPAICFDAYKTENHRYEKLNPRKIDIDLDALEPGCFSGFISLPDAWLAWEGQIKDDDGWLALWCDGDINPMGPWSATQVNSRTVSYECHSKRLRVQGRGKLRIYATRQSGHPAPEDDDGTRRDRDDLDASPPRPSKTIVRTRIDPISGANEHYSFYLEECSRSGEVIDCSGYAENNTDAATDLALVRGRCTDDEGNSIDIHNFNFSGNMILKLVPNVKARFTLRVDDPHMRLKVITLQLATHFGNENWDEIVFNPVPVQ